MEMAEEEIESPKCSPETSKLILLAPEIQGIIPPPQDIEQILEGIGFGKYHWKLLILCGLGWMMDSMWMTSVYTILPRVKQEWNVPSHLIGLVSSCVQIGMLLGALGWGYFADKVGSNRIEKEVYLYLVFLCRPPFFSHFFQTSILESQTTKLEMR